MLHQPHHSFTSPDCYRNLAIVFREKIRKRVRTYQRSRHLPALIHCPEDWRNATDQRISRAILRRLKLALYQQRQARAVCHYTFSRQKYEALLVAIGGELALTRLASKTGQHPAETDSPLPTQSRQFRAIQYSYLQTQAANEWACPPLDRRTHNARGHAPMWRHPLRE